VIVVLRVEVEVSGTEAWRIRREDATVYLRKRREELEGAARAHTPRQLDQRAGGRGGEYYPLMRHSFGL
jgi:hypothetical protein